MDRTFVEAQKLIPSELCPAWASLAMPLAQRRRLILTTAYGYDASHSIVKARQEGLRYVLFKPFRVDQHLEALESPAEPEVPKAKP